MNIKSYKRKNQTPYFTIDDILKVGGKEATLSVVSLVWDLALAKRIDPCDIMRTLLLKYGKSETMHSLEVNSYKTLGMEGQISMKKLTLKAPEAKGVTEEYLNETWDEKNARVNKEHLAWLHSKRDEQNKNNITLTVEEYQRELAEEERREDDEHLLKIADDIIKEEDERINRTKTNEDVMKVIGMPEVLT